MNIERIKIEKLMLSCPLARSRFDGMQISFHPKNYNYYLDHWFVDSGWKMKIERNYLNGKRNMFLIDQSAFVQFGYQELKYAKPKEKSKYLTNHFIYLVPALTLSTREITLFFIYLKYLMIKL